MFNKKETLWSVINPRLNSFANNSFVPVIKKQPCICVQRGKIANNISENLNGTCLPFTCLKSAV
jgi:hypothetical protein